MRSQFLLGFRTVLSLGIASVFQVVVYRVLKKLGYYEWRTPIGAPPEIVSLFGEPDSPPMGSGYGTAIAPADQLMSGEVALFGGQTFKTGSPPAWQTNLANGRSSVFSDRHWSRIADFDAEFGDIKLVWELSRFQWILLFARAYLQSGDTKFLGAANTWAANWIKQNPANCGLNWMCGQETSIRLVHVLLADKLLSFSQNKSELLQDFVCAHCGRISATTRYAIAQKNNHAISEAVGLIIGGSWLEKHSSSSGASAKGRKWRHQGYRLLEKSIDHLVMEDGSFAQYSVVYHRLLVDTLSVAEWWRDTENLPKFSDRLNRKAERATQWLHNFVDPETGDVPNIGGNDGALVYSLSGSGHRDFRPTVQLAGRLFCGEDFYGPGPWNEPLETLGILGDMPRADSPNTSHFPDGGFSIIRSRFNSSRMYCRFPSFKFRPSQSDALHIDLWHDGVNILRDGGTYSYAAADDDFDYFMGVSSHNSCQFDGRDQMPKLGRFLYGSWLEADDVELTNNDRQQLWRAGYTDRWQCSHQRSVESTEHGWAIADDVHGPFETVTLRWRLCPEFEWQLQSGIVRSDIASIRVSSELDPTEISLAVKSESRVYFEKQPIPVLKVRFPAGTVKIRTKINLSEKLH